LKELGKLIVATLEADSRTLRSEVGDDLDVEIQLTKVAR